MESPAEQAFFDGPKCAHHPTLAARREPCSRCGTFACEACFAPDGSDLCDACFERMGARVPWEDERLTSLGVWPRLWATVAHFLRTPYEAGRGVRDGREADAVGFHLTIRFACHAALTAFCVMPAGGLVLMSGSPGLAHLGGYWPLALVVVVMLLSLVIVPFVHLFVHAVAAGVYHVMAVSLGGKASWTSSHRVAQYAGVLAPVDTAVTLVGMIPVLGALIRLAWSAVTLVWYAFLLAGHAEGAHGLTNERKWLAALAPTLVVVLLFVVGFVGAVGLAVLAANGFQPNPD